MDVSKGYADFMLLDPKKSKLEDVFQLDDNRIGHDSLKKLLEEFIIKYKFDMLYCAVESTGGFENNWYSFLISLSKSMPLKVARLNPSGIKKNADAGLKRNVTDALSAFYIAEYLISHPEKVAYSEQSNYHASFRNINKHIKLQLKQQTQLINGLRQVLYSSFPEMGCYCRSSIPNWVLSVLVKYPTAAALKTATVAKLCKIDHVTEERAASLITKAKASVSSRTGNADNFLISSLAKQLLEKQQLIKEHKLYLEQDCKSPEVTLVQSIPGIGAYSAAAIMVEIEDIRRFSSPKKLAAYFGVHPELKESGDKKAEGKMSKKGRAAMRGILYMCAQAAVIHDSHFKSIYHRQREKAMSHKQAIGVVMHKMLRIIWGVLTHGKGYNSGTDKKNQERKVSAPASNEKEELKTKRRYSALAADAPVSKRQSKKRKVYLES